MRRSLHNIQYTAHVAKAKWQHGRRLGQGGRCAYTRPAPFASSRSACAVDIARSVLQRLFQRHPHLPQSVGGRLHIGHQSDHLRAPVGYWERG